MTDAFDIPPVPDGDYVRSPFTPTFGVIPPRLADRQQLVDAFARMLDEGPGARGQATLVTGQRGMGKSVMLKVFQKVAQSRGWICAQDQASPGVVQRLTEARIPEAMATLDWESQSNMRITGGGFNVMGFGGSVSTTSEDRFPVTPDFQHQLIRAVEALAERGSGLLVTLDEVHRSNIDELRQVTDALSAAVSERAPVAFVGAGLPASIDDLVNDRVSTYLRRAERIDLELLTEAGAREGLTRPLEKTGKSMSKQALEAAVAASGRYPYLVQLIGDEAFKLAGIEDVITISHVRQAAADAQRAMYRQIHEPTFARLSKRDRDYLYAMSADEGPSMTIDVAKRMDMDPRNAGAYRNRLLAAGVIESPARGVVTFTMPYTREYILKRERPF
ncbi:hypothetical protein Bravens_00447 [Brevibacterium ravenspurgense]|uniref:Orc1-like AAA ATPase domain-containing protein n=1 Tax=Brevibacterium ravenspurgense TaxID=479117 RepID=A0A150HC25_9MICO|nr:AAA family ATPase [Brevibacterium ravenspurgense]KXZ59200.1 hypothetical protein Bravens_00447 [Brevibacterium ravenspurgense]